MPGGLLLEEFSFRENFLLGDLEDFFTEFFSYKTSIDVRKYS